MGIVGKKELQRYVSPKQPTNKIDVCARKYAENSIHMKLNPSV